MFTWIHYQYARIFECLCPQAGHAYGEGSIALHSSQGPGADYSGVNLVIF
jgi:hypothetical protein